ncbi:MAG: ribosome recycling factor [Rickettsiales bacterium]|jgi:ribosome recycling factor|nr:ribosome recycling factor [Rickettsiales bacterium]
MEYPALQTEAQTKTAQSIEFLRTNFSGLRTGRASVHLLDGLRVEVYGAMMPIDQLATLSTPEAQTISISVWDQDATAKIEKAIRESNLGLNPMTQGTLIRLNMPPLTEERRKELVKVANGYAEEAKIAMRNIRQDLFQKIKRAKDDKEISEDDQRAFQDDLQKVFDAKNSEVDAILSAKEKDVLSI